MRLCGSVHGDSGSWESKPWDDQLPGLTTRLISLPAGDITSSSLPLPPSPLGRGQRWVAGGVIDLSVTLGDADIHLESEPSGTFDRNRASDRTAVEGAGAGSPCYSGAGRTETDDGARWCLPTMLTSRSRRISSMH